MLEWLKRHAWKACSRLKRLTGSNPVLSATENQFPQLQARLKSWGNWFSVARAPRRAGPGCVPTAQIPKERDDVRDVCQRHKSRKNGMMHRRCESPKSLVSSAVRRETQTPSVKHRRCKTLKHQCQAPKVRDTNHPNIHTRQSSRPR